MKEYINVRRCAACGKDHTNLKTKELAKKDKFVENAVYYTHYVVCPNNPDNLVYCADTNKDKSA